MRRLNFLPILQTLDDTDGGFSLPFGPVFMSPKSMAEAALEALAGPEIQKKRTLKRLLDLFDVGSQAVEAAYGNKESDKIAYLDTGISPARIYIVNEDSVITNAANGSLSSYLDHASKIDEMFPKLTQN